MSAKIILGNILTSSVPALFTDEIHFEVTFSVSEPISDPLVWRITYVGSAYSEEFDQILEEFEVDSIDTCGTLKFDIACKSPDPVRIPRKELFCVTALLLTASYRSQEFIRVGYYVHNQFEGELPEGKEIDDLLLPDLISKIKRTIISDKPRVTRFNIDWSSSSKDFGDIIENKENGNGKTEDSDSISQKSVSKESEGHSITEVKMMNE